MSVDAPRLSLVDREADHGLRAAGGHDDDLVWPGVDRRRIARLHDLAIESQRRVGQVGRGADRDVGHPPRDGRELLAHQAQDVVGLLGAGGRLGAGEVGLGGREQPESLLAEPEVVAHAGRVARRQDGAELLERGLPSARILVGHREIEELARHLDGLRGGSGRGRRSGGARDAGDEKSRRESQPRAGGA